MCFLSKMTFVYTAPSLTEINHYLEGCNCPCEHSDIKALQGRKEPWKNKKKKLWEESLGTKWVIKCHLHFWFLKHWMTDSCHHGSISRVCSVVEHLNGVTVQLSTKITFLTQRFYVASHLPFIQALVFFSLCRLLSFCLFALFLFPFFLTKNSSVCSCGPVYLPAPCPFTSISWLCYQILMTVSY